MPQADRQPGVKGDVRVEDPTPAESTTARRAAESRATVPVLELSVTSPGLVATGRLVRACALALREHPRANASYRDGRFELYSRVNVGVLIAAEDAYIIPTVFDADQKERDELTQELEELRRQASAGTLAAPALSGATFTVWNAAEHGILAASIPVVPPQAAALSAGIRDLTLACDHRILYGAPAIAFVEAIRLGLEYER